MRPTTKPAIRGDQDEVQGVGSADLVLQLAVAGTVLAPRIRSEVECRDRVTALALLLALERGARLLAEQCAGLLAIA
jgi:hypothetical protein